LDGCLYAEAINKAFQCKLVWKILTNEESTWPRTMRAKYLRNQNFLTYTKKKTDSPVWKSLVNCQQLLRQGIVWRVGTGDEITFWYDNWIEPQSLIELVGLNNDVYLDPNIKVSEFIHNAQWDVQKLNRTLNYHPII